MCSSPASLFVFGILSKKYPDRRREALHDWSGTLQSMAMEPDAVVEDSRVARGDSVTLEQSIQSPWGLRFDPNGKVRAPK